MKFSFFFDSIERDDRRGSMMDYTRITRMDVILLFFVKVINAINAMMILS